MPDQEVVQTPSTEPIVEPAAEVKTEPAQEVTQTDEKRAEKTFTQAELDEIVQKRITKLERKLERQRIETETRAKVVQELQARPEPSAGKPRIEDYSDYSDYQEALTDWKVDEKLKSIESRKANEAAANNEQAQAARVKERQAELIETGERKYDDFEEVVKSDSHTYSQAAYLAILESDISADIVYHLAKNQDEAKRISGLPAYAQAKEIGKLEDRIAAKKPIKTSNAPKPVEPIGSGSANAKRIEDMTIAEYTAYRRAQGARW